MTIVLRFTVLAKTKWSSWYLVLLDINTIMAMIWSAKLSLNQPGDDIKIASYKIILVSSTRFCKGSSHFNYTLEYGSHI